jgi:predicted GNAT family acetyltransferase
VEIVRPDDAETFLRLAGPLLERDEARNQLPLGIAGTLAQHREAYDVVRYWVVREAGEPVAAAIRTEPYNLVLGDPASETALVALIDAVMDDDPEVPGVVGNVPFVETAAELFEARSARIAERTLSQGVYGLVTVRDVARAPGMSRVVGSDDRALLVAWLTDFTAEAVPEPAGHIARIERMLDIRYSGGGAGFWIWEEAREPVSLAGFSGPTPTGIRVGPVYTPPEHRGRGYATTLVADLSTWLLGQGHRACFLYTDLANPTSNRIYVEIGYERVCDAKEFSFRPA